MKDKRIKGKMNEIRFKGFTSFLKIECLWMR